MISQAYGSGASAGAKTFTVAVGDVLIVECRANIGDTFSATGATKLFEQKTTIDPLSIFRATATSVTITPSNSSCALYVYKVPG